MGVKWTEQQQKVIDLRNRNILVSAAAGSGKTAVLVERIIQKITDEQSPVDVDRLLIVTFTEAAAAEMKDRIREAIEKKLEEDIERCKVVSDLHEKIAKCEMVRHDMVDGNPMVQRTTFSDGTKVTVDFEKQTYVIE